MAKRSILTLLVILAFSFTAVSPVLAQGVEPIDPLVPVPSVDTGEMVDETPSIWFVELASPPTADGVSAYKVQAEHDAFKTAAAKAGLVYTERYSYSTLFNGFSISIKPADLALLNRIPGVKNIYPVDVIAMPETLPGDPAITPELFSSLNMIGATAVQSEMGYTGAGIKVAVMDTGIDVNHPAFGGDGVAELNSSFFFSSPRVKYGYDLVGDDFNADDTAATFNPVPVPDDIPDDCAGHGTHVAGIIGANDATNDMKGVAPEVTFGAYRVFGCEGSTFSDVMLEAMELAKADGMQVLNMSIGSSFQWPQYPTAVAASRLVDGGMVVVASIGNSGDYGLYAAGAPGLGEKVIGVASFDNTMVRLPYFTVAGTDIGYVTMTFSPAPPTTGSAEIVNIGRACNVDTLLADPAGKIALAARGTCSFGEKATKAINAGAIGVVVSNNAPGVFNGTLGAQIGDGSIPVVGISKADGDFIRAQSAPITLTWTDQEAQFPSPTGGLISSFSSYGLSPDLALKPDIGAPGGNIFSSYPLELGGYVTMSGTSMASPHVAGAAALLLNAKPSVKAAEVRGVLMSTSSPQLWSLAPSYGLLDEVHRQGAGLVQIDKAILARGLDKVTISPEKISAGESEAGTFTQVLTLTNRRFVSQTYDLSYENALSTSGVITPGFYDSDAVVKFSVPSITIPGKSTATVTVKIKPATYPANGQYGGYIIFTPREKGQTQRVPFAGFVGDYQGIKVLTPTAYGFPWIALSFEGSFYGPVESPADWVFTMVGEDVPYFLVHFEHQSAKFTIKIFDALTNQVLGTAYTENYLPRNSTSSGFFAFPFDGRVVKSGVTSKVADGTYYAKIKVLKANGNPLNPAHWETWTSPIFEIDRP